MRFLLGEALISSKTNMCSGSKKRKRSNGKVRNNKTISTILSLVQILYRQQNNIFCCFYILKFENSLFSHKLFAFAWNVWQLAVAWVLLLVFCKPCPVLRNCKSVFLIWKSLITADRVGEFSFFQGIHVRTDIRIYVSISLKPMTKFGKQVHLGELAQMRLIK